MTRDQFNLHRFVTAQAGVFEAALKELACGQKRSHWMWFIFPQLRGLGASPTAQLYGLSSLVEAAAYLDHPVLGPRLKVAVDAVQESPGASLWDIFGPPDDLKFCSCMTLFSVVNPEGPYRAALDRWCERKADMKTMALLGRMPATEIG